MSKNNDSDNTSFFGKLEFLMINVALLWEKELNATERMLMGTTLYSDIPGFQNLGDSFLTLFQVLTLSSWEEIMRRTISAYPFSWIYFVTFIFIASIMVLNLFIAVLVDMVSKIRSDKK